MKKLNMRWVPAAALAAGLLAGCGGGGGGNSQPPTGNVTVPANIAQNVSDLIAFMLALIATDENSDATDVNPLTLATDDMGDPAPL